MNLNEIWKKTCDEVYLADDFPWIGEIIDQLVEKKSWAEIDVYEVRELRKDVTKEVMWQLRDNLKRLNSADFIESFYQAVIETSNGMHEDKTIESEVLGTGIDFFESEDATETESNTLLYVLFESWKFIYKDTFYKLEDSELASWVILNIVKNSNSHKNITKEFIDSQKHLDV